MSIKRDVYVKKMCSGEDTALVKDFQAGNKAAFDKLVLKYQDKIFNLCYRFMGEDHDADDAAQETFVKVFKSLKGFRFESAFSTWLYRIAVNICKNKLKSSEYRRKKTMISLSSSNPFGNENKGSVEIKDETHSPNKKLEKKKYVCSYRRLLIPYQPSKR